MKTTGGKKTGRKSAKTTQSTGKIMTDSEVQDHRNRVKDEDDDLPEEHIKNLEEALKGADRGEPVTLNEFRKMAKKWGKEPSIPGKSEESK